MSVETIKDFSSERLEHNIKKENENSICAMVAEYCKKELKRRG